MNETVIVRAEVRPFDVPMKRAFGIAGGAQELAANALVRLELAGGAVGFGEAAPFPAFNGETQALAVAALERLLPGLVGRDAGDLEALTRELDFGGAASARAAIETALVDAWTRARGTSVRAWLGGREDALVTDITIVAGSVEDARRDARAYAAYRTLKIKVGGAGVDHDVARVLAIHAARPEATLMLDANGGFTADEAIALARELARRDVAIALFEQPVAAGPDAEQARASLARVARDTGVRLAIDESVTTAHDVAEAARHRSAHAVNIKIMKSGVFEAIAIARAAEAHGLDRMVGGLVETRLAMGMSASLAAGLGGFRIVDLDTPLFLAEDPFDGGFRYEGDRLVLGEVTLGHGAVPTR